jgi:hypothetical protein
MARSPHNKRSALALGGKRLLLRHARRPVLSASRWLFRPGVRLSAAFSGVNAVR